MYKFNSQCCYSKIGYRYQNYLYCQQLLDNLKKMAENNEEKPQLPQKSSALGTRRKKPSDNQNAASINAFNEFVYENDEVFRVGEDTYVSMDRNDSLKKMHEFVVGGATQKSASRDSGIDGPHTQDDDVNFEALPRKTIKSDPGKSNPKLSNQNVRRASIPDIASPKTLEPPPRDRAYGTKYDGECCKKIQQSLSISTHGNSSPLQSQGQKSPAREHIYETPDIVEESPKNGRIRLSTTSWQERELASIEEIELYTVEQTLQVLDKLKISRRDALIMNGKALVENDEDYFVSHGLTAFEARKLYKYVRGWRPKDHQQCSKDPSKTINKWSAGDVRIVMNSPQVGLPQIGDFAAANQVDGLLLMDLVENKYMIGIEDDYGVKLSLSEDRKLVSYLEKKRKEIGFLTVESVAKILKMLQLVKHVETFKKQNIYSEKLNQISESQLKEIGLTAFEARKLYKYLNQGWRPRIRDHCAEDLKKRPVDEWSVKYVRTYLLSMKLSKLAKFAGDSQIDGVMLRDLVENNYLESLEHDYGVQISLGEFKKLNELLKEIQQG